MTSGASSVLAAWSNFYVMAGSAAAGLTGLMFVVITLVRGERGPRSPAGISTFSTPTVVHFGAALLASAILIAPWPSVAAPAVLLGLAGAGGVVYVSRLMYRTRHLTIYSADLEDWVCYAILPCVAYATMLAGAIVFRAIPVDAPFVLAAAVVMLIFIGIRNSWDIVTYIAIGGPNDPPRSSSTAE